MKYALLVVFALSIGYPSAAQDKQLVRIAKITVDSARLADYNAFLKEGIEAAMKSEPGVLVIYAVAEKKRPTHITILEIYADDSAYKNHIQTPHFLKYKNGTKEMVTSLELLDVNPLMPGMKIK